MRFVVPKCVAAEFTGTQESADAVVAAIAMTNTSTDEWTLKSFTADVLTLHLVVVGQYEQDVTFPAGWIVCAPGGPGATYTDEAALDAAWYTVAQ